MHSSVWGLALRNRGSPRKESDSRHFGHALAGSIVGVAAGTSIGLLLWRGAAEEGLDDEREYRTWRDDPDPATLLFAAGLFAIVAGGPVGAVEGAGMEERRTEAYVVAGVGKLALGGLGYGLARRLNASATGRLLGLGVGAAIGAAAGATLVASKTEQGAVTYRNGTWQLSPPDVRIRPRFGTGQFPSIDVTLVSVQL